MTSNWSPRVERENRRRSGTIFLHHKQSDYRPAGKSYKPSTYKLK